MTNDGARPGDPGSEHSAGGEEQLGSAAEEAAKLFGALSDWAKEHGGDVANNLAVGLTAGLAGFAGHAQSAASDLARDLDGHVATGAPECTYCPICRTVHVIREAGPDVMVHLASAGASLMQAASAVFAAASASGQASRRTSTVEKIDLDPEQGRSDDWPEDLRDGQENQE